MLSLGYLANRAKGPRRWRHADDIFCLKVLVSVVNLQSYTETRLSLASIPIASFLIRWLDKSEGQLQLMDREHLGFGKGIRLCLGQHIAGMQLKKFIPMLVMRFRVGVHTCLHC
jgi:hypothetical protein